MTQMNRRRFAAMLATAGLLPSLASARSNGPRANLRDFSTYFNNIITMQARFQQYNEDGSLSAGTLYMKRPGRMRMEYDDNSALMLVMGGSVAVFDSKSDQDPTRYPLRRTPLWNVLRPDVDLGRPGAIKSFNSYDDLTRITAYDDSEPESGRIVLEFDTPEDTIELKGWEVRTALGERVLVRLRDITYAIPLSDSLFNFDREIRDRARKYKQRDI